MKTPLFAILLIAAALLPACSTQPIVTAQARPGADLRAYATYAFRPGAGTDSSGNAGIDSGHVKNAVHQEMAARGYTFSEYNPDLLVDFSVSSFNRQKSTMVPNVSLGAWGSNGGISLGLPAAMGSNEVTVSRVSLGLLDSRRREVVWEGVYEGEAPGPGRTDPGYAIQQAVHGIFMKFPIK